MDRVTLDRDVFKALASDTRLDILKALDERQKTVTELARELDLNKATVFEHLEKLADVGLIQKLEDDRKWVYWQLSWKGRRLLHPEKITLAIVLSTAGGSLLTGILSFWLWLQSSVPSLPQMTSEHAGIAAAPESDSARSPPPAPATGMAADSADFENSAGAAASTAADATLLIVAIALAVLFVALLGYALYVARRARRTASA